MLRFKWCQYLPGDSSGTYHSMSLFVVQSCFCPQLQISQVVFYLHSSPFLYINPHLKRLFVPRIPLQHRASDLNHAGHSSLACSSVSLSRSWVCFTACILQMMGIWRTPRLRPFRIKLLPALFSASCYSLGPRGRGLHYWSLSCLRVSSVQTISLSTHCLASRGYVLRKLNGITSSYNFLWP